MPPYHPNNLQANMVTIVGSDITNKLDRFRGYCDHRTLDAYRMIVGCYESLRKLLGQGGQSLLTRGSRANVHITAAHIEEETKLLLNYIHTSIEQIRESGSEEALFAIRNLEEAYELLSELVVVTLKRLKTTGLSRLQES